MNAADKKVSLEIPLNTEMKIFAFLFKEKYSMYELFSGTRTVGYYGESQPFSIGTNTNSLSLGITLIQVPGSSDTTAPSIEQVTAIASPTSDSTPNYTFASTKAGTITYGGPCSSGITSAVSGNNTITLNALSDGTYSNCTIKVTDADGNVSNTLTIPTFIVVTTSYYATAISMGSWHSCAILDNGAAKCWGRNNSGQLGINNTNDMGDNSSEMSQLTGINLGTGRTATAISAGNIHTCAVLDNGAAKCWGSNRYGELGIDSTENMGDNSSEMSQLTGINLGTGRTATAISAGSSNTCAVLDNGAAKCWGFNRYGQLGTDNTTTMGDDPGEMNSLPTIYLGTGRTATAISAGNSHNCAILDNGAAKCWGRNNYGQLGTDNTTTMGDDPGEMDSLPTINLGTGRTATAISAGNSHTCAILDNGAAKCWGKNNYGQLGIDSTENMGDNSSEMSQLTGINLGTGRTATAISAGNIHTCAVLDNGAAKCWGKNKYGQLGIDSTENMGDNSSEMSQLTGINLGTGRTATAISTRLNHTCVVLDNGAAKCWGFNNFGRLGIDNTTIMGDDSGEMASLPTVNL
jgi:alpha-tubulin suppressor-like RCC1 family protein